MKLTNINTILTYVSLILALTILLSVVFGCYFKKNKLERFANSDKDSAKDPKKDKDPKRDPKDAKKDGSKLSPFESKLIKGLGDGTVDHKEIENFIQQGTFTKENLENMIAHVEQFKNKKKN